MLKKLASRMVCLRMRKCEGERGMVALAKTEGQVGGKKEEWQQCF